MQYQNTSYQWIQPTQTIYNRVDNGQAVSGLIGGVAVRVTCTHTAINNPNAFAIQIESDAATSGTVVTDIDNFAQGSSSGGGSGAVTWEEASQQCVTAIRNNTDTTKIMVPGYQYSGAKNWRNNHPDPWITDSANNFAYEAHYYFDRDNSGDYPDTYASENTNATGRGYANLAARVTDEFNNFTDWLAQYNAKGYLGEFGWPNNGDTTAWNAIGEVVYDMCDARSLDVTYWAGGARWGATYNLSIYSGENQETVKTPATIVHAHF